MMTTDLAVDMRVVGMLEDSVYEFGGDWKRRRLVDGCGLVRDKGREKVEVLYLLKLP